MATVQANSYGKRRVRLTKVVRRGKNSGEIHDVYEFTVDITLRGEFEEIYTRGDNSACVPTDTMKNSVYAVAKQSNFDSPEAFGLALTARFVDRFDQVHFAGVEIEQAIWTRITVDGADHHHSFTKELFRRFARVERDRRGGAHVGGGVSGLQVLKSAGSSFEGFSVDEYTTLGDAKERIFATTVEGRWNYAAPDARFNEIYTTALKRIKEIFATHQSPSVQATLYVMGERLLEELPAIDTVSFTMPNQHHILFDLSPFGMENDNEVFYGTDEPFGIIEGTITR